MDWESLVQPYSPWLSPDNRETWERTIPNFHRPVFDSIWSDLDSIDQIISVIGPRRVGKSTLLQQIVKRLLDSGCDPQRVIYYSMDDPARLRVGARTEEFLDALMRQMCDLGRQGSSYLLLDEIQTLENWELYLKKYYDLKYPVRILISGSASSPIFKKSRESLLGRIKDYHVLPFSYREFVLYQVRNDSSLQSEIRQFDQTGSQLRGMLAKSPEHLDVTKVEIPNLSKNLWDVARSSLHV